MWLCLRSNQGHYAKTLLANDALKSGGRHELEVTAWN
jgi:hypothetical protein